jgi:hypothetical protein
MIVQTAEIGAQLLRGGLAVALAAGPGHANGGNQDAHQNQRDQFLQHGQTILSLEKVLETFT